MRPFPRRCRGRGTRSPAYGHPAPSPGQKTWRQTSVDGWKLSGGQLGPLPGQFSGTSQAPADGRQTTSEDLNPSAGQSALVPVQLSATSQSPADERQTVPADVN
jgi:hypothetical protein